MSVAKVIEITASSPTSFAEAAKAGIAKASETVHGIKGAWVSEESLVVENDQVTEFRDSRRSDPRLRRGRSLKASPPAPQRPVRKAGPSALQQTR